MEKKMNIRGAIRRMKVGEMLTFKRGSVRPSYVRSLCSTIKQDYNIGIKVEARGDNDIILRRYA